MIKNTSEIKNPYIKVLVHGPAGSGKTRLCATTGGTPLIISAEAGLLSLRDENVDFWEVKSVDDLKEAYKFLTTDEKYDWVCVDSITEIAETVLAAEKATNKDPRKAYGEMQEIMMGLIRSYRDLPKNIYMAAKQEKVKDEISGAMLYGPSAPGQKVGPAMPYMFDEIFALHNWKDEQGESQRAFQTSRDVQYEAKDRSGSLDFTEKPDLSYVTAKILGKNQKKETKNVEE